MPLYPFFSPSQRALAKPGITGYFTSVDGKLTVQTVYLILFSKNSLKKALMIHSRPSIQIDLEQFKLHINIPGRMVLTLLFDTPSRRFYLSLMAFVIESMKRAGGVSFVPLSPHVEMLSLLNETVGGSAGSSGKKRMLNRIYQKWKNALPDLESAPLFKVLGRKKAFDDAAEKGYRFDDQTKDAWANLFAYQGSGENIRLRLCVDGLGVSLDDIAILYGSGNNGESPWELFLTSLREKAGLATEIPLEAAPDPVLGDEPDERDANPWKNDWQRFALLVLLILLALGSLVPFLTSRLEPDGKTGVAPIQDAAVPMPLKPSIAVLPFTNLNGDPSEDYLSDGITEQIITALAKTPKMRVIARNSSFSYKGKPTKVQNVAKDLSVRYVLEGSVQKADDRLRITAQLIDAKTGNHLWAEKYDRALEDIFKLQDDITKNIITSLQVNLTEGEIARLTGKGTHNLEAFLKVQQGVSHVFLWNKVNNKIGRQLYREAIALDPSYSNAYVCLGWTYLHESTFGWTQKARESRKEALEWANKAISLDPSNGLAYRLASSAYMKDGRMGKALENAKKAISLDPNNADILYGYASVLDAMGQFSKSIPLYERAISIDPISPWYCFSGLGWACFSTGRREEAATAFKSALERRGPPFNFIYLACALISEGKPREALDLLERALTESKRVKTAFIGNRAIALVGIGKPDEAVKTMRDLIRSNPKDPEACRFFSFVLNLFGNHEEALQMARKAVQMRNGPYDNAALGMCHVMRSEYDRAIPALKKATQTFPDYLSGHVGLAAAYSLAGRMEDARGKVAEIYRINPKTTLEDLSKNGYYAYPPTDKERFLDALRKAGLR